MLAENTPKVFVTWSVSGYYGQQETREGQLSPQQVADKMAKMLTARDFLDGETYFSVGVRPIPRGQETHEDSIANPYMHVAGTYDEMTVEVRIGDGKEHYAHYVVAREPVKDPEKWVSFPVYNGNNSPLIITVHPEEVFTGEQAAQLFRGYILHDTVPAENLLRQLDI